MNVDDFKREYRKNFVLDGKRSVGKESEYPMVYKNGHAVKFGDAETLLKRLGQSLAWSQITEKSNVVGISGLLPGGNALIDLEYGACTLEIGFPASKTLSGIETDFNTVFNELVPIADDLGILVLGYGIQPVSKADASLMSPKDRYFAVQEMIGQEHPKGEDSSRYFSVTAAEQVHVDVGDGEAIDVLNTLNRVYSMAVALFSNSPVYRNRVSKAFETIRDHYWTIGIEHGRNKGRTGVPKQFEDWDDFLNHILSLKPLFTKREVDGKTVYVDFNDVVSFREYLDRGYSNGRIIGNGGNIILEPTWEDARMFNGTVWYVNRFQPGFGTVESRMFDQQPPGSEIAASAFVSGLVNNWKELKDYLDKSQADRYAPPKDVLQRGFGQDRNLRSIVRYVLSIAKGGLAEKDFLRPLYDRLDSAENPAQRVIREYTQRRRGGLLGYASFKNNK